MNSEVRTDASESEGGALGFDHSAIVGIAPDASNDEVIDLIMRVYRERGDMAYGEDVTERMHALQCGALAEREGGSDALVAASFLHDIGHLLHDLGEDIADRGVDAKHEDVGDRWLRRFFPDEVTEPVRLHVESKRYLARDAAYRGALSPASEKSLVLQGGPMTDGEARTYEAGPHFEAAVQLRRYDDTGKDSSIAEIPVEHFRAFLERTILPEDKRRTP